MKFFSKKPAIIVVIALVFFLAMPKPAFAQLAVTEVNPILTTLQTAYQLLTSQQSVTTAIQSTISALVEKAINAQQLFEWAFKIATEALRRQLLNMIVDQIVAWIQGGGTPKFITDWPGFFRDAVDQAGGRFLQQMDLGLFCSPYNLTLRAAFIPIPQFSDRSACTLSQIGVNLDSFLKNFNNGGWVAWNEMVLKPQNNIYGAYLLAWDQYEIEKSAAQKAAEAEAQAGKGFLSVKKCIRQHTEPQCISVSEATGQCEVEKDVPVCDEYQINTPGSVVGDLAAQALGSDIPYIISAQDFGAYVAAITNAILNRVFAEGVGLLHTALSGSSGGGGGGGSGGGGGPAQCAPFLGGPAYNDCVNAVQAGKDIKEFQKNYLTKIIDLELGFQNQLLGAKQATLIILNQSLDVLKQLETCQKFPHPDTVKVQSDINTITGNIAGIQSDIIALQLKQQQIKDTTELGKIPSLYAQVAGTVNPEITQSLALAAQQETSQKQAIFVNYQSLLNSCLAQQQLLLQQQQQQQPQPSE